MTTTDLGPYEHTGAYQGSELFDTSGVPDGFCPDCEHAPCVAGFGGYCEHSPRFIVATAAVEAVNAAADSARADRDVGGLWVALRIAVGQLEGVAWGNDFQAELALQCLASIRRRMEQRTADRTAPKDES